MKKFYAVGEDEKGRKYAGMFEAPDEAEARRMLLAEGYKIVSIEETDAAPASETLKKKASLAPHEPSGKETSGRAFAGGKKPERKLGLGAAFTAGGFVLAGLLAVTVIAGLRKENAAELPERIDIDEDSQAGRSLLEGKSRTAMAPEEEAFLPEDTAVEAEDTGVSETEDTGIDLPAEEVEVTEYRPMP